MYRNRYIIISLHIMYIAQYRHTSDDTQSICLLPKISLIKSFLIRILPFKVCGL